jgi:hypothetical protein
MLAFMTGQTQKSMFGKQTESLLAYLISHAAKPT